MKLKITVGDKIYDVDVEVAEDIAPRPAPSFQVEPGAVRLPATPVQPASAAPTGPPKNEDKVCRSPVTGTVVRLVAQQGQSIQHGDVLLVLEAMKMETNITAPVDGKIAAISVNPGDSVKAGQVVVELE